MESQSLPDTIFEEREEEFMFSQNVGITTTRRKTHFLKPTAISSNDGEVSELPQDCLSPRPYDLKDLSEKASFKGWKHPTVKWRTWVLKMHSKYQALWKQIGIYEAVMSSRYDIRPNKELLVCIAEKWCLETNTFVFPWAEATITLEDVMVCGGFSVVGDISVLSPLKTKQLAKVEEKLIKGRKEAARGGCALATPKAWMEYFMGSGHELEHEAFLSLWLSNFVFATSASVSNIGKHVFSIAIHLARGHRVALAPAVLASIYRDLRRFKDQFFGSVGVQTNELVNLYAPFQLLQIWVWERFPGLRPRPNSISNGEPRVARWHRLKVNVTDMKLTIDSAGKSFQWRPYGLAVKGRSLPKCYGDEEQRILIDSHTPLDQEIHSFAICLRVSELVGVDGIEQYLPHRVSMQFCIDQDLPGSFVRCNGNDLDVAWRNYSRPIRDAVLYVPPRLLESDVTAKYSDWWKHSVLAHCIDDNKPSLKRPRSPRELNVSVRKNVCKGNCSKGNEDKGVEAEDLVQEENMEDQLTIKEWLNACKVDAESESHLGAQTQSCSTKDSEALGKMEATMKPCVINIESSDEDEKDETLENICEPLSVGGCQNVPTLIAVADKDVKKEKCEEKQVAEVTKNGNSIGESKGLVIDDVKINPGLKDEGEGSKSDGLELETRIYRLEKMLRKLKK